MIDRLRIAAPSLALGLFFLVVFAVALHFAFGFPVRAQRFALFVLSVGIVLILAEFAIAFLLPPPDAGSGGLDLKADDEYDFAGALKVGLPIFAWVAALLIAILLIGPTLTVPLWLFAYLLFSARLRPVASLLTASGFAVITIGLFDYLLQIPWPSGMIRGVQEWSQAVLQSMGI